MFKEYPIIEIPNSNKKGWLAGAYCFYFMYTKYKGNFILKGYRREIEEYIINENITHYMTNIVMFNSRSILSKYNSRNSWEFWKKDIHVFSDNRRKGIEIKKFSSGSTIFEHPKSLLEFKRMPHRWIPEFDKL